MDSSLIEPGRHIGELRIERELGRGAFGTVFLARDSLLHRLVALKVVRTPGGELGGEQREQALKEARLIAGLHSPHIVTLYRVHSLPEGTGWMFEMEYVEGGSLHALFKEKRTVPLERTLPIVCAMVRGLKVAHDRDIVHGDIKPANVLLGKDGEVKLADFGLARFIGDHSLSVSDAGQPVGTPSYMAPEVIMGEAPRVASDIWSVGVLLYRILGGKLPFHEDHLLSLFLSIQNAAPALLDPATPPELADLAFRCLTKEPELRPTSCEEILATLERPQTTAVARVPGKRPKPVRPPAPELFGRETEEERLGSLLLERSEGSAKTVLLSGEAGIGKTSLVRRVMADDAFAEWLWIEASLTAAQGLLRAVAQGAGDVLDSDFTRFGAAAPVLRQLTSVGGPDALVDRQQGVWAVEELLAGLAAERPVAVFVEDAQIADDEDIEVLKGLSRRLPLLGVPLVINYRMHDPSSSDTSGTLQVRELAVIEGVQCVDLVPLPNEALYRVVESFVGGLTIGAEILERVVRLAAGNPFFAKELMRHLEDSRAIVRQPPDLVPGPGWADAKLPSSLTGLVERRLGDLDEEDRTLLDVAAVDGMEFDGEALASALDRPLLTVLRSLQRLYRDAGLLVAKDRGFRFSNAILQETIYEGLAPELRRALHQRLAAHLEKRSEMAPVDPARL
ncbi:MAG: protein kinase, partial [Planctomycetota bacterium]|nr:protein kinase [Planctomycetota bacterium]